jgi:hypothetical protein
MNNKIQAINVTPERAHEAITLKIGELTFKLMGICHSTTRQQRVDEINQEIEKVLDENQTRY